MFRSNFICSQTPIASKPLRAEAHYGRNFPGAPGSFTNGTSHAGDNDLKDAVSADTGLLSTVKVRPPRPSGRVRTCPPPRQ